MTHTDLVLKAERWLLNTKRCAFVFTELVTHAGETPDAIGFRDIGVSMLVECKANRADFLSDKKKYQRRDPEAGMGAYRFYMCPTGLIKVNELPDKWGLIYINERGRCRQIVGPKSNVYSIGATKHNEAFQFKNRNKRAEKIMMMSALRRLHLRGVLPQIYEQDY